MLALLLTATLQPVAVAPAPTAPAPDELWRIWQEERVVATPAPCLRHAELIAQLEKLAARFPGEARLEEVGRSFEDRSIHLLTVGHGPRKVFLWSQMHGDEPSATPALLDLAAYLLAHRDEPLAEMILGELTLLIVPMLNPDGSEIYERRNAQWIDVNRDALNLATPEGRLLKRLRDEHEPILGFNLHDQNRRTAVGETGRLATNAVLAVAGDPEGTVTPGRLRAKRACAAIVAALAPLVPGGMARYDEDWSPRAFGDNLTAWGTPVVLIESGGLPPGGSFTDLSGLNFVALLTALTDLARDDLAGHDPELYENLERNRRGVWADVVIRGGRVLQPASGQSYRADLAFNRFRDDRAVAGCDPGTGEGSRIVEVGDARFLTGGEEIDASEGLLIAALQVGIEGWSARNWLTAETLTAFARRGVGELVWEVPRGRLAAAQALSASLARPGSPRRPLLVPVARPAELPVLRATAPPDGPVPETWREVLAGLGGPRPLSDLWRGAGSALRPGRPASLILLAPWSDDEAQAASTRIHSVWLGGVRIER